MIANTYTTVPLLYGILMLWILSKTQTKEQTQKPGFCCPAYPYDSYAPAILDIHTSPETAEAVFDK